MAAEDPRGELDRLAQAGRQRRLTAESAAQRERQREHLAERRESDRIARMLTYTSWSSLSRWAAGHLYALLFLALGICGLFVRNIGNATHQGSPVDAFAVPLDTIAFAIAAAIPPLSVVGVWRARRGALRLLGGLPFATEGFQQVLSTSNRAVTLEITFASEPAPEVTLRDLVVTAREPTTVIEVDGPTIRLEARVRKYSVLDDHCRWMPRWYRALCRKILVPLHKVHPIVSVRLR